LEITMPTRIERDELQALTERVPSWSRCCPQMSMTGHTCRARSACRSKN